ncbi:MAG TPA: WD40 repeat domain-containing protein [Pyrinomonadaceae bacterium]|nr:WD40 repeat domain-containing protein [Pyrinomonadaceae bacterium]
MLFNSPYKGLMPYSEEDAPFFFGRERERELIKANLMASRLTLLYGVSGVGKSSVLRAGVVYQLREMTRQHLAKRRKPKCVVVNFSSWRDDPIKGLAERIRESVERDLPGESFKPVTPSRSLIRVAHAWCRQLSCDLLIILDQFEEYFLYHPQEEGKGSFAFEFSRAVNCPGLRAHFLISIREDAWSKLNSFKAQIPGIYENNLRIEHLDREAAQAAIEKPVEQYNLLHAEDGQQVSIEPELVAAILDQVKANQVGLSEAGRGVVGNGQTPAETQIETPYLQMVLTRLWDEEMRAGSNTLRLETLNRLGGAKRIVQTHLDAVMEVLPAEHQEVAAQIFHYLVTPSGTKIAQTADDLTGYTELPKPQIERVLNELSGPNFILRKVPPPVDRPTDQDRYEIFHDVLASAILDWRRRYTEKQLAEQIRREEELRRERERAEATRMREIEKARNMRRAISVLVLLSIMMIVLSVYAFRQRDAAETARGIAESEKRTAEAERGLAQSRELAATAVSIWQTAISQRQINVQPGVNQDTAISQSELEEKVEKSLQERLQEALRKALEAADVSPTEESQDALRTVLGNVFVHSNLVLGAAFSPDGKQIVTASLDDTARVWEASTGTMVAELRGHREGEGVNSASFSPDGRLIVTASADNTARIWEASTGQNITVLRGHRGGVNSASFSPDGKFVITASFDNTARVWDLSTRKPVVILGGHTDIVRTATFSPDGKRIVTASLDDTARVWEASTGTMVAELRGHREGEGVNSASFSPDSRLIVTASADGTARVWDANTAQSMTELTGHRSGVFSASFSPDGKFIVTASADGTVRVWDARTGQSLEELTGHTREVSRAAFSPDGKFIATASFDNTARIHACRVCGSFEDFRAIACTRVECR